MHLSFYKNLGFLFAGLIGISLITSCSKDDDKQTEDPKVTHTKVLDNFAQNIAYATYKDLYDQNNKLYDLVIAFEAAKTDANLQAIRDQWRVARKTWEQSEGFLFGPVATENVDPRIDTWPVNFNDLDGVLASGDALSDSYIDAQDDALKGFHPIEYLIFGLNGDKKAADVTPREIEYLKALATNLKKLTTITEEGWRNNATSFAYQFKNPGSGSSYPNQLQVFEELVNAIAGICDEVANAKISEPFLAQDPTLEESPYSGNSITDFTNNITSISNVYYGKYNNVDGEGLEDIVRKYNLSVDAKVKSNLEKSIEALNKITIPFGRAITEQPVLVQNAIDAINALKDVLEGEVLPLVQQNVK